MSDPPANRPETPEPAASDPGRPWPPQDAVPGVESLAVLEMHESYEPDLVELGDMDEFREDEHYSVATTGRTPAGALLDIARNNPVGTALAAAGLALMLAPRIEREDARRAYRRARDRAKDYGERARAAAADSQAQVRATVSDVRTQARDWAEDWTEDWAEDSAEDWGERLEDRFQALRARIDKGTEDLGEEARQRVIAARRRALEARDRARAAARDARRRADRAMHEGAAQARDSFREHPLLAGALALGVGAVIGAALPRSKVEKERPGDLSHRLLDEAEALYRRERARLERAARAALQESREIAAETAQSVREQVPDGKEVLDEAEQRVREGASRVAESARRGASDS